MSTKGETRNESGESFLKMSDAMNVEMTRVREDDLGMIMDWHMRPYITRYMNTDSVLTR